MVPQVLADFREAGWWALSSLAPAQLCLLPGWLSVLKEMGVEGQTAEKSQGAAKGWVFLLLRTLGWVRSLDKLNGQDLREMGT